MALRTGSDLGVRDPDERWSCADGWREINDRLGPMLSDGIEYKVEATAEEAELWVRTARVPGHMLASTIQGVRRAVPVSDLLPYHERHYPTVNGVVSGTANHEIGTEPDAETVIDVHGATLAPGFWDSHFHPYFGDYSPRQRVDGAVERTVMSGTTTLVSAGAGHQPGMYLPSPTLPNVQATTPESGDPSRARDARGSKALAITMTNAWRSQRPLGVKCHAGTVFAEDGFVRDDFADLVANGIRLLKFQRPISRWRDAQTYSRWAGELGLLVMTHTGNRPLTKDTDSILESLRVVDPDIAGHVNGGPAPAGSG